MLLTTDAVKQCDICVPQPGRPQQHTEKSDAGLRNTCMKQQPADKQQPVNTVQKQSTSTERHIIHACRTRDQHSTVKIPANARVQLTPACA